MTNLTSLPTDANNNPMPVLKPTGGSDFEIGVSGTTARNGSAFNTDVVGVYAETSVFIKLGDATVEAASDDYDAFIPEGGYREFSVKGITHIAAIRSDGTDAAKVYINGLK